MLKCLSCNGSLPIDPGYCLKCGSYCDLESSFAAVNRAWISITRHVVWSSLKLHDFSILNYVLFNPTRSPNESWYFAFIAKFMLAKLRILTDVNL